MPQINNSSQNPQNGLSPHNSTLPSLETTNYLRGLNKWNNLAGMFMVGSIVISFIVAAILKYPATVKAQARVRPTGELRLVQAYTDGIVKSLNVRENQIVKTGDVLAILDDYSLQIEKSQLQTTIQQVKLELIQITAQIKAIQRQISAEKQRGNRSIISAEAEFKQTKSEYQERLINTTTAVEESEANLGAAKADYLRLRKEIASTLASLKSAEESLKVAKMKQSRFEEVAEAGALSLTQFEDAKLGVIQAQETLEIQQATLEAQQQNLRRLEAEINAAEARLKSAKGSLKPSKGMIEIAEARIGQEKATLDLNLANLIQELNLLQQQKIELEKQLERNHRELSQTEQSLDSLKIVATAPGTVIKINIRNIGQTVSRGEEIAQIVPDNVNLVIKSLVSPQDINKLKVGQLAQMRVSACPYPDYGLLKGNVTQISQDTIESNQSLTSQFSPDSSFYEVDIQPETNFLQKFDQVCPLQLGMEGRVDIISQEETILQFLLRKARLISDL